MLKLISCDSVRKELTKLMEYIVGKVLFFFYQNLAVESLYSIKKG